MESKKRYLHTSKDFPPSSVTFISLKGKVLGQGIPPAIDKTSASGGKLNKWLVIARIGDGFLAKARADKIFLKSLVMARWDIVLKLHCTLYDVQTVHCTLYHVHCTLYTASTLYIVMQLA